MAEYKDKINLALYKCNILPKDYDEFKSFALIGLLDSYKILLNGDIIKEDFDRFAFVTMKRKIIDEIRRRNRVKYVTVDNLENLKIFKSSDMGIAYIDLVESVATELSEEELRVFNSLLNYKTVKQIMEELEFSKSKTYYLIASVREKCKKIICSP
ncbi:sigma-70 family RNA polymerase sigma factor [Gemella sp. GH3]|uniref:sigma-70 family RNA polymerase sigma factor n=1 Tax=unclassified Gemella TaxID=2624949 RepID=UPI0015CFB163|nr:MULTISPECIES: sigma-70 family RNA polymerase sigma factor [unclassified Gemella]MBF0713365.1 sigma-70 family RNA polymerase sigma factor [Gemella sp. GH3.1]NYS50317.1 sigma-70 family RNA polymerase sigma factor [Gemella sp. GH3]